MHMLEGHHTASFHCLLVCVQARRPFAMRPLAGLGRVLRGCALTHTHGAETHELTHTRTDESTRDERRVSFLRHPSGYKVYKRRPQWSERLVPSSGPRRASDSRAWRRRTEVITAVAPRSFCSLRRSHHSWSPCPRPWSSPSGQRRVLRRRACRAAGRSCRGRPS